LTSNRALFPPQTLAQPTLRSLTLGVLSNFAYTTRLVYCPHATNGSQWLQCAVLVGDCMVYTLALAEVGCPVILKVNST
jgi:hypothetical protein